MTDRLSGRGRPASKERRAAADARTENEVDPEPTSPPYTDSPSEPHISTGDHPPRLSSPISQKPQRASRSDDFIESGSSRIEVSEAHLTRDEFMPVSIPEQVEQPWERHAEESDANLRERTTENHGNEPNENVPEKNSEAPAEGGEVSALYLDDSDEPFDPLIRARPPVAAGGSEAGSEPTKSDISPPNYAYNNMPPPDVSLRSGVLPPTMSAFEYAIRPFLDISEIPRVYDNYIAPLSPIESSVSSASTSASSTSPHTHAPSSCSNKTEQLFEPPPPEDGLPSFLHGQATLENRLKHLTLTTALMRCAVISRLAEGIYTNPHSVGATGPASKPQPRSASRARTSRSRSRARGAPTMEQEAEEAVEEQGRETRVLYSSLYTLAFRQALPIAQSFEHRGFRARCHYWIGRAEAGLENWENARKAFERAERDNGQNVQEGLKGKELDVGEWLQKVKRKVTELARHQGIAEDDPDRAAGLGFGTELEDEDAMPSPTTLNDQWKGIVFEDWELEYIRHGDVQKFKTDWRKKYTKRKAALAAAAAATAEAPSSLSKTPTEKQEKPWGPPAGWQPPETYPEPAFSPWNDLFTGSSSHKTETDDAEDTGDSEILVGSRVGSVMDDEGGEGNHDLGREEEF